MAAAETEEKSVSAVERALLLLDAFKEGDVELSLAELARRTGFYKSTILRLTATLERFRYLVRANGGGYRLGPKPLALSESYQRSIQPPEKIMPALERIRQATGESAALMVRQGAARVCAFRVDSQHSVRYHWNPGDVGPLDRGAAGKILMAFEKPYDPTLAKVRAEIVAVTHAEVHPEVTTAAAPVFDQIGNLIGALCVSGPQHRFGGRALEAAKAVLRDEARRLTAELGGNFDARLKESQAPGGGVPNTLARPVRKAKRRR